MSITAAELDADLVEIVADFPQSVTIAGGTYACVADELTVGRSPDEAGIFSDDAIEIHVRTALFTVRPVAGATVTYGGRVLRVASVRTAADDNMVTLVCQEKTA